MNDWKTADIATFEATEERNGAEVPSGEIPDISKVLRARMEELLPSVIREHLPALYGTQHTRHPVLWVKLFTPWSDWTWYVAEFDGTDVCFGLVHGFEKEWGYFNLAEIAALEGPGGIRAERDLYFEPVRSDLLESTRKNSD